MMSQPQSSTAVAACCANFYEQDWVQQILGQSFHPGGIELSRRLAASLKLSPGAKVLDVACGIGTTTRLLAQEQKFNVTGLDFSELNLDRARTITVDQRVKGCEFLHGSADQLPFSDATFDAVVCECAVSTFAQQAKVAQEFRRVLRPGGVLAISDMVVNGQLPDDIAEHIAPWTCMANAKSVAEYQRLFLDANFSVRQTDDESDALLELSIELKRKLVMLGVGNATGLSGNVGLDLSEMRKLIAKSQTLVRDALVGYFRMVLETAGVLVPLADRQPNRAAQSGASQTEVAQTARSDLPVSDCGCGPDECC